MSQQEQPAVTLTIDGKEVTVPAGTLVIRAAEALGIEIPRFCDHPLLEPVAACRQCYVKVEGQRKLMTSCSTPVTDGMVVHTQNTDEEVKDAQEAVLEFLLINHPLDCPICDRGGECPLQDQALAYGTAVSRYVDPKRTYRKPIPLSPLVNLDRERCVLCARCTRFCDEISGDRFIELFARGAAEQVSIAPGEDFESPFSGNTVQICPVGALTSTPYRFAARPFDLRYEDSVCPHCACGCNLRVDTRRGEVVRHLARDNYDVNDAWLCDKGRYAFRWPDRDRVEVPMLRRSGGLEPASFGEIFATVAEWSRDARVAVIAGGRLSDEDAYALSKLARTGFGTNDVDHRMLGAPDVPLGVERVQAAGMPVTYADVERAKAILVVGVDAEQELPILHLRIRKAVRKNGARVFVVHPRQTRLHDVAEHVLVPPGAEAATLERMARTETEDTTLGGALAALRDAGASAVVLAGPRLADSAGAVAQAAAVARSVGGRFALLSRRANDRGALGAGLHPALLPGGRSVEDDAERAEVEVAWEALVPKRPGRHTGAILRACAAREIDVLYLVGVDPLRDFPDAGLARRALQNVRHKIVQDATRTDLEIYADAVLPAAPFVEKDGHYTDWEGRSQRFRPVRRPTGLAQSDWEIFQGLSEALGRDMGFRTLEDLHEEMARFVAPRSVELSLPPVPPAGDLVMGEPEGGTALFTYSLLVDEGRLLEGAPELKGALEDESFVEMHPDDASRLGLEDGAKVRVSTSAGEALLPLRVVPTVSRGAAFVPFNQPGLAANTLLSGRHHTAARIEAVDQATEASAEAAG